MGERVLLSQAVDISLTDIIRDLEYDLNDYKKRDKVSMYIVNKRLELIGSLKLVNTHYSARGLRPLAVTLYKAIASVLEADDQVDNFIINITTNKKSLNTALITIDTHGHSIR